MGALEGKKIGDKVEIDGDTFMIAHPPGDDICLGCYFDDGYSKLACNGCESIQCIFTKIEENPTSEQVRACTAKGETPHKKPKSAIKSALDKQEGGDHYKVSVQPIEYILANNLGFCEGNVVKYITRWKNKNGVEDLKKVIHYVEYLIEQEESK